MTVGLVTHAFFAEHDFPRHPENQRRLTAAIEGLRAAGLWDRLPRFDPQPATAGQLDAVHTPWYVAHVRDRCSSGAGWFDQDTYYGPGSYRAAVLAAGAAVTAADLVMAGTVSGAFALARPPGHHAEPGRAMGFCLFNHVAVAARHLQRAHGLERILILDWDVHHGNGTQETFYADPSVLYISLHQWPHYPGTGGTDETGRGEGRGFTVNIPLPAGTDDRGYQSAFEEIVLPRSDRFRPQFVLISAGQDCHVDDPLGNMAVTADGFHWMASALKGLAASHCGGRMAAVLEGGYNLHTQGELLAAIIEGLL